MSEKMTSVIKLFGATITELFTGVSQFKRSQRIKVVANLIMHTECKKARNAQVRLPATVAKAPGSNCADQISFHLDPVFHSFTHSEWWLRKQQADPEEPADITKPTVMYKLSSSLGSALESYKVFKPP